MSRPGDRPAGSSGCKCSKILLEVQNYAVDAVTQPRRLRAVIEYMPEMRFTAAALYLRPVHPVGMVGGIDDTPLADRLIEAGPAAAALEFGIAAEKRVAADGTIVGPDLLGALVRAGPGPFGSFVSGDIVDVPG